MFHEATRGGSKSSYDYLGYHYHYALGVRADYIEARYWYDAALAAGIDDVKIDLAFLEEDGLGGPRNKARAKRLYKESSEINSEARFHLVRMEDEADILDLKQDEHVAAYKAAMEKGSQAAKLELASIYLFSSDKHKDVEAAKQLLQELADEGYSDAYVYMGAYYDEVSQSRTMQWSMPSNGLAKRRALGATMLQSDWSGSMRTIPLMVNVQISWPIGVRCRG